MNYPYIRAWNQYMGSYPYYDAIVVKRAEETNAPQDALFELYNEKAEKSGNWRTLNDLDDYKKEQIVKIAKDRGYV